MKPTYRADFVRLSLEVVCNLLACGLAANPNMVYVCMRMCVCRLCRHCSDIDAIFASSSLTRNVIDSVAFPCARLCRLTPPSLVPVNPPCLPPPATSSCTTCKLFRQQPVSTPVHGALRPLKPVTRPPQIAMRPARERAVCCATWPSR